MSNKTGRSNEQEISLAVLRYLATIPQGEATIDEIKKHIPKFIDFTNGDMDYRCGASLSQSQSPLTVKSFVARLEPLEFSSGRRILIPHKPRIRRGSCALLDNASRIKSNALAEHPYP